MSSSRGKMLAIVDRETSPLFKSIGAITVEVSSWDEVVSAVESGASKHGARIVLVLKHLVEDEDSLRSRAERAGVTLLVLPSVQAKAEPIDVNKLIARALGFG